MSNQVYIIGASMTAFGKRPDETVKSLTASATAVALADAGVEACWKGRIPFVARSH